MTKKKALNTKLPKPYSSMSGAELDAETKKFDRELIVREGKPLTPSLQRKLSSAHRKRGRPRVGKGSKRVLITLERGLLQRSDAFARRKRLSRSQLIALGLESLLELGLEQLRRGESLESSEAELLEFFEAVKKRARARAKLRSS